MLVKADNNIRGENEKHQHNQDGDINKSRCPRLTTPSHTLVSLRITKIHVNTRKGLGTNEINPSALAWGGDEGEGHFRAKNSLRLLTGGNSNSTS